MESGPRNRLSGSAGILRKLAERLHWTSLDSVAVLLAYQEALLHLSGVRLPAGVAWLLGGGVWAGYTADRMLDVVREPRRSERSPRHRFHQRHLTAISLAWMCVVGSLVVVGFRMLPRHALLTGLGVAVGAAAYVWFFGRPAKDPELWRWPKRCGTVALLALGGIWWSVWYPPEGVNWLAGVLYFMGAAWASLVLLHHFTVGAVASIVPQICVCGAVALGAAIFLGDWAAVMAWGGLIGGYGGLARWALRGRGVTEETLGGALDAVLGLSLLCLTLPW